MRDDALPAVAYNRRDRESEGQMYKRLVCEFGDSEYIYSPRALEYLTVLLALSRGSQEKKIAIIIIIITGMPLTEE